VIVTAGTAGKAVGRLDVVFDEAGHIVAATGAPIPLSADIEEDPEVVALLAPYAAAADALLAQAVGTSRVDLDGERARVRSAETNLGNLIADAMLAKTRGLGTSVALMNGGGIRASIPSGEVTMGKVLEVLPFGNKITTVRVHGRDLTAALENGVSQVESGAGRFPQVAGVRFTYDPGAPAGGRVRSVELWDRIAQAYRAVLPDEDVVIATNDFLAGGGDGYNALASGTRYDTGWLLSDALAEHVAAQSPVTLAMEGRIQTVAAP
jgi:5'-nucleotidase